MVLNNKEVYIIWENRLITNPSEYATILKIYDITNNKQIYNIQLHQTVKPIQIGNNQIIMLDNYPNSPNRFWIYDTNKKTISLTKLSKEKNFELTDRYLYIKCTKSQMKIPSIDNVANITCNQDRNMAVLLTDNGTAFLIK